MYQVFRDSNLNNNFKENGYCVLKGLLPSAAVENIRRFQEEHPFESGRPFSSSNYSDDKAYRRAIFDVMDREITPRLADILNDYVGASAAYFVKKARQRSTVGMHIDWQLVNEPEFIGLNVWMPLVRTNRWNGCLQLVPGSHRENPMFRGPNYTVPQQLMKHPEGLAKHARKFFNRPGDLVIYDNRLLHFSGRNRLWKDRPAISFLMVPTSASPEHYYFEPAGFGNESRVRKYKVSRDFYIEDCRFRQENGVYQLSDGLPGEFEYVDQEAAARLQRGVDFLDRNFGVR